MTEQQIDITDLSPAQLQEVKKQLDAELDHLTNSYSQLKQAQAKFKACVNDIGELTPKSKVPKFKREHVIYVEMRQLMNVGKEILVPLTSSLYVPGKINDPEYVVVDVGTGYYVRKTKSEARQHYTSKSNFVQQNLETLQKAIEKKQDNVQSVVGVLQSKLQEQRQAQPT
ncbi:prefoldin, alpha subunit [Tremella mesenterica]|uniref:Prefoldin, alpha subunit n=1 Tax=Tremella mesenterica TaxID=5217 RepID=A0A4V1M3Q1_TREME|nr:prefoldin, alpha subunit [Tremella mesenterica]